jgi:hypothetical protein
MRVSSLFSSQAFRIIGRRHPGQFLSVFFALSCAMAIDAVEAKVPLRPDEVAVTPRPLFASPWLTFNTAVVSGNGSPVALAVGDVDNDGDLDVVAPRGYAGGGFTLLRNEGNGRFAQPVTFPGASGRAAGIALGDLNNDGKLDVVVSDGDGLAVGNSMSIYLGNGDGTFGSRQPVSLGTGRISPIGIATGDFDNDGDVDIAVACNAVNVVRLLRNNGAGIFTASDSYPVGMYPADLAAGDMNGDGRADLVVAHEEYSVSVLINNGTGGFVPPVAYDNLHNGTLWAGPQLPTVALADVNRDGKLDVLYGNTRTWDNETGQIVQLRNNGNGALTRAANIPLITYTAGPTDIVAADMNADGAVDILAASYSGRAEDGVCVALNNGDGTFGPATLYPAGQTTRALAAADVNGDGKLDVLTADDYSNAVAVYLNPGSGVFPKIPYDMAGSAQNFQDAADVDGDGDLDMFTSGPLPSADNGSIMRNNGSGRFPDRTIVYNVPDGVAAGVLRDLNGDGKPDLLFNNPNTSPRSDFFTALNDGHGNFPTPTRWLVGSAGWGKIDAFDIDNDGDLDVIDCEALGAPGIGSGRFFIAINNGNGTFQQPYAYDQFPPARRPDAVAGGDFNHDGNIDLAFANQGAYGFDAGMFVVLGNGNGTFQAPQMYTAGRGPAHIVTADFDHDGNLDIATLNSGYNNEGAESLTIFFGTGTGSFNRQTTQYATFSPDLLGATGLDFGDVDGDGDVDLLASGASNDVSYYVNNGAGVFSFPYRLGTIAGAHAILFRDFTGDGVKDLAVLNSPPPIGFDGGVAVIRGLGNAPVALSSVSRKAHGASGSFDLPLPLSGTPGVECRSGGATNDHTLVVTFGGNVAVTGAVQAEVISGAGAIGQNGSSNGGVVSVAGNAVTIPLTNVANAQTVLVRLNNVTAGSGSASPVISMSVLAGDVNGNGAVTASDVGAVKAEAGLPITAANFRMDLVSNGTVNASDVGLAKASAGSVVP